MRDSSGVEFFYLSQPRSEEAGIITLGHHVNNAMIIPPRTSRHDIFGKCSGVCTSQVRIIHSKIGNFFLYIHIPIFNYCIIAGVMMLLFATE